MKGPLGRGTRTAAWIGRGSIPPRVLPRVRGTPAGSPRRGSATERSRPQATQQTHDPVADYRCFNSSNVSIRPWSWNYRSCWHQTCPPVDSHHCVWIASIPSPASAEHQRDCCGSSLPRRCFCIGQFARLLPALAVVAVSQAPSPESNPYSPSPVEATVVHYTTVPADRSEVHVIKRLLWPEPPLCQRDLSLGDQPGSTTCTLPLVGALVFRSAGRNPPPRLAANRWQTCAAVDLSVRVLATRFWRMSHWAPMVRGASHTLSRR